MPEHLSYDEAQAETKALALKKLQRELRTEAGKVQRQREIAQKNRERLDKKVAFAVSARPDLEAWYAHPGPLSRDEVREAVGLSDDDLHRLMVRYRRVLASKPAKKRRAA